MDKIYTYKSSLGGQNMVLYTFGLAGLAKLRRRGGKGENPINIIIH